MRFIKYISFQLIYFGLFLSPILTQFEAFQHDKIFYLDYLKEFYIHKNTLITMVITMLIAFIGYLVSAKGSLGERGTEFSKDVGIAFVATFVMLSVLFVAIY